MSNELIEKLREDGKFLSGNFGKLMHEAADALEAKAAPVGEVKRYIADVATCVDVIPTDSVSGAKFVLASDYATLEAELERVNGEYEWVASINTALDESNKSAWAENAKLRAELERRAVPDGWRELLQEVAEYAPPYGTIVAMTSQMALGSKARRMLAAAPSAPKADDPVKQMLLEALSKAVHYMENMQDEIDGLINYAGGTGGFGEYEKHIEAFRAAIAAARKGEGE